MESHRVHSPSNFPIHHNTHHNILRRTDTGYTNHNEMESRHMFYPIQNSDTDLSRHTRMDHKMDHTRMDHKMDLWYTHDHRTWKSACDTAKFGDDNGHGTRQSENHHSRHLLLSCLRGTDQNPASFDSPVLYHNILYPTAYSIQLRRTESQESD